MVTRTCPRCGAQSTDPEFCSDCGSSMQTIARALASSPPKLPDLGGVDATCPSCGEPRPGKTARFCDNCRYDFTTGQPFSVSVQAAPARLTAAPAMPPPVPSQSSTSSSPAPPRAAQRWDLRASVDLSWRRPADPMPTDQRERIFPLDLSEHLIGRRSDGEDIHPEIALTDPGISRRHGRIARAADGALTLIDFGSLNGTKLNGAEIAPHVPMALADDDVITIGTWTRLVVKAR